MIDEYIESSPEIVDSTFNSLQTTPCQSNAKQTTTDIQYTKTNQCITVPSWSEDNNTSGTFPKTRQTNDGSSQTVTTTDVLRQFQEPISEPSIVQPVQYGAGDDDAIPYTFQQTSQRTFAKNLATESTYRVKLQAEWKTS